MHSERAFFVGILILGLGLWACKAIEEPPNVPQYWEARRTWEIRGVLLKLFEITPGDSLVCVAARAHSVRFFNEPLGLSGSLPADSLHPLYDALWLEDQTFIARIGSSLLRITLTASDTPTVDTLEDPTDLQYLSMFPGDPQAFVAVPENSEVFYRVELPSLSRTTLFTGLTPPTHGIQAQGSWILDSRGILYDFQGNVLFQDTTLGQFVTFGPDSWLIFVPHDMGAYLGMLHWPTKDTAWLFLPDIHPPVVPYWQHGTLYFMQVTTASGNLGNLIIDFFFFIFFRIWPGESEGIYQYHFYVYTGPEVWRDAAARAGTQSVPVRRYFFTPSSKMSPP